MDEKTITEKEEYPQPIVGEVTPEQDLEQLRDYLEKENLLQFLNTDASAPTPPEKYDLMSFFREVLGARTFEARSKVGNLTPIELGLLNRSVRRYADVAAYAEVEGLDEVTGYLRGKAGLILGTSLSRKGFLITTAISQKRVTQNVQPVQSVTQKNLWGEKTTTTGGENDTA